MHNLQTAALSTPMADSSPDHSLIAVMGATGSGKTTFINVASGSNFRVGHDLRSCTDEIQVTPPFECRGRQVVLVDTPGFNDTELSDTDVLKLIAEYLATVYKQGKKVTGVIFLHAIDETRVGGIARSNFKLFRELCGESSLVNVVIVTTKWDAVTLARGEARQAQLASEDIFFKPALTKGARMLRHDNTFESARSILYSLLPNTPMPLLIQHEIVDLHRSLGQTAAGAELNRALMAQAEEHAAELRRLEEKLETAIREKDEETHQELEAERAEMQAKTEKLLKESQRLQAELSSRTWKQWAMSASVTAVTVGWGIISNNREIALREKALQAQAAMFQEALMQTRRMAETQATNGKILGGLGIVAGWALKAIAT